MTRYAKLLTDGRYREHTSFWKENLSRLDGAFHFRQTWHSYALTDDDVIEITIDLDSQAQNFISGLTAGNELAAFVVVLGAIDHALHLYTGANTICVDSPLLRAGSSSDFNSTIPLIVSIDRNATVQQYLDQIRQTVAGSYTYQDFPIDTVWETLLKRSSQPSTNVLVWSEAIHDRLKSDAPYDLVAEIKLSSKLHIVLRGKSPVLAKPFLENFGRHIGNILSGYSDLQKPFGEVNATDEAERDRLLHTYNQTRRDLPLDKTISELFYARASQQPEHIALRNGSNTTSYRELNESSNRLAWFLKEQMGIQPGDTVGLFFDRSELPIIGLLAILKAGAVYLPLDAEYPSERLVFMAEDANVRGLLIRSDQLDRLMSLNTIPMFALDLQLSTLETSAEDLPTAVSSDQPAYIIYTSGSTGKPKGVVLEHRGFVNTALHHIEAFQVTSDDRLSQFYAASFDSSLFEIFVALLSGATLVLVRKDIIGDPDQFAGYIESQQVTMLTVPPIYLSTLKPERLGSVKKIVSAGDNPRLEEATKLARTRAYYNSYGPTETSVCVTHHTLDSNANYGSRLPIGKPISNVSLYVVDEQLRLTPEGCIGEICVGGVALARGYLNRDEITSQAFVSNPFIEGERLYRTGDLGIWLPDGNLEMVGRKDSQVKIRGYRIELGEVELAVAAHANVREAVVLAREDNPGDKRLVAYVTLAHPTTVAELREYLKARLPEFMIPTAFVVMTEMPVTANGKIDRKALPAPQDVRESEAQEGPQNEVQNQLVAIWRDVLGIGQIGINDNFFEHGGDSILIIQMVSQAAKYGLRFTPQQVFDHQTVAALAAVVERAETCQAEQETLIGQAEMLPMQRWFFSQQIEGRSHYNQSVMLDVPVNLNAHYLRESLQSLLAHHDALRARFVFEDGGWTQEIVAESESVPLGFVDLSGFEAGKRQSELESEAALLQAGLDITNGPMIRVQFFRLDDTQARLLFVINHLVVDGVSWRVLLEDFYTAYQQRLRGESVEMPPKTTSVREWALRLKSYTDELSEEYAYWADDARRGIQKIPLDYEGESNSLGSADEIEVALTESETHSLLQEAPRAYNTQINDILITAFALTMKEWTGHSNLLIDLESHGREDLFADINLSRTVGWLTAVYPALLRVESDSLDQSLIAIKEQIRRIPRHGIGYGVLRYLNEDQKSSDLASLPQAQIVFNYLGQTDRALSVNAEWRPIPGSNSGERTSRGQRSHVLEITSIVMAGRLRISWEYSRNLHQSQTINRLAERSIENLRSLISHCCSRDTGTHTASDFPAAKIDQKTLDSIMSRMGRQ